MGHSHTRQRKTKQTFETILLIAALSGLGGEALAQITVLSSYINPPVYADYPDPDIIRVGSDFYFSTTTFIDVPGLTILHSQDLVHWEIVTHLVPQLTGSPNYNITNGVQAYGNGVFASSLRHYNGTFYCV